MVTPTTAQGNNLLKIGNTYARLPTNALVQNVVLRGTGVLPAATSTFTVDLADDTVSVPTTDLINAATQANINNGTSVAVSQTTGSTDTFLGVTVGVADLITTGPIEVTVTYL